MQKKRVFTTILMVMVLALIVPSIALAATVSLPYSGGTLSITYPDAYADCEPFDQITVSGITPGHSITIYFQYVDTTTGWIISLGSAVLDADGSVSFPYPEVAGTMTFAIAIRDNYLQKQIKGYKWTITCEPPPDSQGCTPGYWRNHYASWPAPYSPATLFNAAFVIPANWYAPGYFSDGYTLSQAIWQGGGDLNRLARHGTAALLSAASPYVNYPYTVPEVISMVQAGFIDPLAQANESYCPLN